MFFLDACGFQSVSSSWGLSDAASRGSLNQHGRVTGTCSQTRTFSWERQSVRSQGCNCLGDPSSALRQLTSQGDSLQSWVWEKDRTSVNICFCLKMKKGTVCYKGNAHHVWMDLLWNVCPTHPLRAPSGRVVMYQEGAPPDGGTLSGSLSRSWFEAVWCTAVCTMLVHWDFKWYYPLLAELNPYQVGQMASKGPR